jgi:signal transduction histidine kinase
MKSNPIVAGQAGAAPRAVTRTGSVREHFVASVAHDLESSLLVLRNNAEGLREVGDDLNQEQTRHLAEIERATRRMRRRLASIRRLSDSKVELVADREAASDAV